MSESGDVATAEHGFRVVDEVIHGVERTPFTGTVVEDRWGLRWRADLKVGSLNPGWCCRSAGLRTWRTDAQMVERSPLTFVRVDRCFAGDQATVARQIGQAEDEAVTFALDEDPEDDPRFVRGTN